MHDELTIFKLETSNHSRIKTYDRFAEEYLKISFSVQRYIKIMNHQQP